MTSPSAGRLQWQLQSFHDLDPLHLYRLLMLRIEVFVVEQACAYQDLDGKDEGALHLTATLPEGQVVACARLLAPGVAHPEGPSIGRVITHESVRGRGVGRELMERAMAETRARWGTHLPVALAAQDRVVPFYRALGFIPAGRGYLEDGIPHTPMLLPPDPPESS